MVYSLSIYETAGSLKSRLACLSGFLPEYLQISTFQAAFFEAVLCLWHTKKAINRILGKTQGIRQRKLTFQD